MGASPLMSLGMRAMAANYAALQVTGHNIANANVPGYSRQRVELATAPRSVSTRSLFTAGRIAQRGQPRLQKLRLKIASTAKNSRRPRIISAISTICDGWLIAA